MSATCWPSCPPFGGGPVADLEAQYADSGYGDLKKGVVEAVLDELVPFQQRVRELLDDPATLDEVLARGAARAREEAAKTLADVYDKVGFLPPARPGSAP